MTTKEIIQLAKEITLADFLGAVALFAAPILFLILVGVWEMTVHPFDRIAKVDEELRQQTIDLLITPMEARERRAQLVNLILGASIKRN